MARYDGDGSYKNLLVDIYGKNITGNLSGTNGADNGIKYLPISLLRAGYYGRESAHPLGRESDGNYWLAYVFNSGYIGCFNFNATTYKPQVSGGNKSSSFSLRCVAQVINKNCL